MLLQCDVPRMETIQACQNLALYWFSVGDVIKTDFYSSQFPLLYEWCGSAHYFIDISYSHARTLRLNVERHAGETDDETVFVAEVERRCFWATWVGSIVDRSGKNTVAPWKDVAGLLLPCSEDEYENKTPVSLHSFNQHGFIESLDPGTPVKLSTFGAIIYLFSLW